MRRTNILLIGTLLLPLLACGGGGGESSSNPAVNDTLPSTTLAATFVTDANSPPNGTIWLANSGGTGDLVTVKVNVKGVNDIFAAGFDVDFNPNAVEFLNWEPGNLLEKNSQVPIYQVRVQQGKIVVGASLSAGASAVDIPGTRILIYLRFRALKPASSSASFDNATLLRPGASAPESIPGMTWIGGHFQAN